VYSALILSEPSLLNYWQLNEVSGSSTCADSKGSIGMSIVGATLGVAGIPGCQGDTACSFNGTSNVIQNSGTISTAPAAPFTVEIWAKTSVSSFLGAAFNSRPLGTGGNCIEFRSFSSAVGALVGDGSSTWYTTSLQYTHNFYDNIWHHWLLTVTSTTAKIYFDGTYSGQSATYSGTPVLYNTGAQIGACSNCGGDWWSGQLCQCALYTSVLSDAAILNHYNMGITTPPPSSIGMSGFLFLGV
jgi:hypothetical protein